MAEIKNAGVQVLKAATLVLWIVVLTSTSSCNQPKPKWRVGQVSLVGSPPVACKTAVAGGHLVVIGTDQVAQPVPYADKQPSPEFNLFDNASYCAVADV